MNWLKSSWDFFRQNWGWVVVGAMGSLCLNLALFLGVVWGHAIMADSGAVEAVTEAPSREWRAGNWRGFAFTDRQRELVKQGSALYRSLPAQQRERVEEMAHGFLAEVEFAAVGADRVCEQARLVVAMEASVLIMERGFRGYRRLRRVEFWNHRPVGTVSQWAGDCDEGRVRLFLPELRGGNSGIIIHEFAHVLDFADDRQAQGIPVPAGTPASARWAKDLSRDFPKLAQASHGLAAPPFLPYAATNHAEFFAETTTLFLQQPARLRSFSPELFARLKEFYGFDPREWRDTHALKHYSQP